MNSIRPTTGVRPLPLGRLMITPAARDALAAALMDPFDLLARHATGDWGIVCAEDREANDAAVHDGDRVLSAYALDPDRPTESKIWVITEADRRYTTVLLPDEY